MGWHWHQLHHMHFAARSRQTEPRQHLITHFLTGRMLFMTTNKQYQSIEGITVSCLCVNSQYWHQSTQHKATHHYSMELYDTS